MKKTLHRLSFFLIFALSSGVFANPPLSPADDDSLASKVDRIFAEWDKTNSPGCALAVIKNGEIIYKRGYGMANLEYGLAISPKSVFRIGSTSKQFTATAILLLAEQGKLLLDDDIRKYIPELPEYEAPIMIRHLIHHTSGIRDYLTLMYEIAGMRDDDFLTEGEVLDLITRQKELNFKPGDEYLYSNSGYFLLSVIVKRVTGKSLREFAEEKIFKPLGMNNTHFHDDHTMIVKNRASGYSPKEEGGFRINMTTLDMIGDGGIFTTVEDLYRWDMNFYHNKLGKGRNDLIEQLLTLGKLNNGKTLDYAFGLRVSDYKGLKMISHGGAFVGFRAEMIRFPEQKFSVICLANLSSIQPSKLARQVADIYLADQFKQPETKYIAGSVDTISFIELDPEKLKEYTGTFRHPVTGRIWKVFLKEGKLSVQVQGGSQFQIAPINETKFCAVSSPVELVITFEKKSSNKPLRMHVGREGEKTESYEAIQVVSPTPEQLAEYVGHYFSDEVQVTYKAVLEDGKLFIRHGNKHKNYPKEPLEPTLKDMFVVSSMGIHFLRNDQGEVTAFKLNVGRVKNIRFIKK